MKLQAITICINFSDYLECVLANRRHFDRWIIMTVESDVETRQLCDSHGIECFISKALATQGSVFHAAYSKSGVVNEALDRLDAEGWAAVIDADVLLPRHFRERLEEIPLESGCLYGMNRRRACPDRTTFQLLRDMEPWEYGLGSSQPLGFFHLFELANIPNRYPFRPLGLRGLHDDDRFVALFHPSSRRCLPMTTLHAGLPEFNWTCRITPPFTALPSAKESVFSVDFTKFLERRFTTPIRAASVGYFPGGAPVKCLAGFTSHIYLLDQYRIHARSADPVSEADRKALRTILERELENTRGVTFLGPHSSINIAAIPDHSLDLLYFHGGGSSICETLLEALPWWFNKLKAGAIVCGDTFLHSIWDAGVTAITALLGMPDYISDSGFWATRLPLDFQDSFGRPLRSGEDEAVLITAENPEDLEPLLLSIHSVCNHWDGPIAVYYRGKEEDALRLTCWRFGCELHYLGSAYSEPQPIGTDLSSIAQIQSFGRALLLREGMLAVGPLQPVFADSSRTIPGPGAGPCLFESKTGSWFGIDPLRVMHCSAAKETACILVCEGPAEDWADECWGRWADEKAAVLEGFAVDVRVRADATIVFIVDLDELGDLQHHWPAMRFSNTPTLLLALDFMQEAVWLPGRSQPTSVLNISDDPASVHGILSGILRTCMTDRVIFLPPTASPLPAAELFLSPNWDRYPLVTASFDEAEREFQLTGNRFVPLHFCGLARVEFLRTLAYRGEAWFRQFPDFSTFIHFVASVESENCARVDFSRFGWKLSSRFQYVRSKMDLAPASRHHIL